MGHVAHIGDTRNVYKVSVENVKRRIPHGSPRCR